MFEIVISSNFVQNCFVDANIGIFKHESNARLSGTIGPTLQLTEQNNTHSIAIVVIYLSTIITIALQNLARDRKKRVCKMLYDNPYFCTHKSANKKP